MTNTAISLACGACLFAVDRAEAAGLLSLPVAYGLAAFAAFMLARSMSRHFGGEP